MSEQDQSVPPAEPEAGEIISALEFRLGEPGLKGLVGECLKASDRTRAIQVFNAAVGTARLPASTDRGRMGRLIQEGLARQRPQVLEVLQTLARDPFEWKADAAAQERLDAAVDELNRSRQQEGEAGEAGRREAAGKVADILKETLEPEEARRLVLLNAFPDVLDLLLERLQG